MPRLAFIPVELSLWPWRSDFRSRLAERCCAAAYTRKKNVQASVTMTAAQRTQRRNRCTASPPTPPFLPHLAQQLGAFVRSLELPLERLLAGRQWLGRQCILSPGRRRMPLDRRRRGMRAGRSSHRAGTSPARGARGLFNAAAKLAELAADEGHVENIAGGRAVAGVAAPQRTRELRQLAAVAVGQGRRVVLADLIQERQQALGMWKGWQRA